MVRPWEAGKPLPAMQLHTLSGKPVSLDAYRGRTLVLNFWATWCEPCRSEMPSLALLQEMHGTQVMVLPVNYKEGAARIEQFAASSGLQLEWLRDADGSAAKAVGVRTFPSTLVIDPQGRPIHTVVGELDWASAKAQTLLKLKD
jgi:thiol-disulfide isomerase/thioredoxin